MQAEAAFTSFEPGPPPREESFSLPLSGDMRNPITPATWDASFTATLPLLRAMLRRYLRDESDVLEAVQQTALRATICRHQFRAEASLSTWLVSIALNEARQILRKRNHQRVIVPFDGLDRELRDRRIASPEETASRVERQSRVRQAVGRLPPTYQTVVRLCELEENSIEQAAQLLRMTPAAVKSRRFRARRLLARYLQQHGRINTSA